ncbi:glucose-6-phosphate isomerase [Balneola vulgaris]|uniref:glucose-6-phosphate isomerase n=1 Tax=Balneola vulgaris TaxID=287535 RepID=UPI0003783725|nr:glucose-6-phosphate isomerase [Balneola vulgaris]
MIRVDLTKATEVFEEGVLEEAYRIASDAFTEVQQGTGKGNEWLGWRDILANPNDALLEMISSTAKSIRSDADVVIICGIGGSYLGAKAVIEALSPSFKKRGPEIIFAGHNIDGRYLDELCQYISEPKADGTAKSVYINVISKSGSTLETAIAFRALLAELEHHEVDLKDRVIVTTGEEGGLLNSFVQHYGFRKFVIPEDVGGRFSVLTPVGLLPIAIAGYDIRTLYYGAVSVYRSYEEQPEDILRYAALRKALHDAGWRVDLFSFFEPRMVEFGKWIQQLLGESEGKEGKGIFPSVACYSTDLHSIGQFVQQGTPSVFETLISVEQASSSKKIEETVNNIDQLNYLSGNLYHEVNRLAKAGVVEAHSKGGVPIIDITIGSIHEENLGELIYFFELFTAVYAYSMGVNPFDQPGVEDYKKAMYRLLGKE